MGGSKHLQMHSADRVQALERFLLGFEGTSLPEELARLLSEGVTGVAIYPRNYVSAEGLRQLCVAIRQAAGRPVLIGIDQEGGSRFALREPFTIWPSPSQVGSFKSEQLAEGLLERMARAIALELRAVGVNVDFAPMLDLAINPESPVTRDRSFGADAQRVGKLGNAFLRGLAAESVIGCAKHFPGHGDTDVDPHLDLPRFDGTLARLARQELTPFAMAINAGVTLVMTAHILLPNIDPEYPASMSEKVLATAL
jgi:beta-N-acetylhexosaminidase